MDATSSDAELTSRCVSGFHDRRVASMADQWQLEIRQSSRDLLVRPCEAEEPSGTTRRCRRGVLAWQNEHGELFFKDASVDSRVYVASPYGLDTPGCWSRGEGESPPEMSRVARLKRALVKFLWGLMEDAAWNIHDLYNQLGAKACDSATVNHILSSIDFESFTEFIGRSGFQANRTPASKQEWFAVFRSIQELSIASVNGISFSALRTMMLDPFHMSFWKNYTRSLLKTELSVGSTIEILRQKFMSTPSDSVEARELVPWFEFLECLTGFHAALGLPEPTASECCRLLYRFDQFGGGEIDVGSFVELVRTRMIELWGADEKPRSLLPLAQSQSQTTALLNCRRRPNVETFTTSKAVRSLFVARARAATYELDKASSGTTLTPSLSNDQLSSLVRDWETGDDRLLCGGHHRQNAGYCLEMALLQEGNSRLSRITSLPVTRLLREGTYFRGQRRSGKRHGISNARANNALDGY